MSVIDRTKLMFFWCFWHLHCQKLSSCEFAWGKQTLSKTSKQQMYSVYQYITLDFPQFYSLPLPYYKLHVCVYINFMCDLFFYTGSRAAVGDRLHHLWPGMNGNRQVDTLVTFILTMTGVCLSSLSHILTNDGKSI